MASGYCVKCMASREMKNSQSVTLMNGRHATSRAYPVCGTKMFKIGG